MSRVCEICGKKPMSGNSVSHAHNAVKKRRLPNLKKIRMKKNGAAKTILICMKCLKAGKASL